MAVTYVRNSETNEFEQAGQGGVATDTTLSQSGKPADAAAVGSALTGYSPKTHSHTEYAPTDAPVFTSSISMGRKENSTVGDTSVAIGFECEATSDHSCAIGDAAKATGIASHAEGYFTVASGNYSHAEGDSAEAKGIGSHAEGGYNIAYKDYSHVEGNNVTTGGVCAHAEGQDTHANGFAAHSEGYTTYAMGNYSHAEGNNTFVSGESQHVQGRYNIEDTLEKYAHIVGNGAFGAPSNAHTIDWDGNAWYAGTVEGTALIIKSPNGSRFKITVDDNGNLSTAKIT